MAAQWLHCSQSSPSQHNKVNAVYFMQESQDGRVVEFPFRDMHPGDDTLQKHGPSHWKGKVKKQIKKDLREMRIPLNDKFLESMLQVGLRHVPSHPVLYRQLWILIPFNQLENNSANSAFIIPS